MRSKFALFAIAFVYLFSFQEYAPLSGYLKSGGDAWGYYVYLPSAFIYSDLKDIQKTLAKRAELNAGSVRVKENGYIEIEEAHALGNSTVVKYTCGIAILNLPFFLVAHSFCTLTQLYPADGFSFPYTLLIGIGTLFYSLLGLWILRKLLFNYFSDTVVAITLLSIAIATNLYHFSVAGGLGMSHGYLFSLYAAMLWATDKFYITEQRRFAALIGFAAGLIVLIRPNEVIVLLFPLLWNIFSIDELKNRVQFIRKNFGLYVVMAIVFLLLLSPQIIYWMILTGKPLIYSYTNEKFDFLHPNIKQGLFGYKNGWLAYTPIMYIAIAGLFFLPKYFRKSALATYMFLPIYIYVIYSWWCWTYINGFGSRPMVETYAFLALPFASFLTFLEKRIIFFKTIVAVFIVCCAFLNLFQTWQFMKGMIWTEDSNREFFKAMLLKAEITEKELIIYDCGAAQPDMDAVQFVKLLQLQEFEDTLTENRIALSDRNAIELKNAYSPAIEISAKEMGIRKSDYLKISCWAHCVERQPDYYRQAVLVAEFKHGNKSLSWRKLRLVNKIGNNKNSIWHTGEPNQSREISFFVNMPYNFNSEEDAVRIFVWNPADVPVLIDDVRIELWREK